MISCFIQKIVDAELLAETIKNDVVGILISILELRLNFDTQWTCKMSIPGYVQETLLYFHNISTIIIKIQHRHHCL